MIDSAVNFVLSNQLENGSIRWAAESPEAPKDDSLLTGCCSITKSLICAINCASKLEISKPDWRKSLERLQITIINNPESFDKTWESKKRFSISALVWCRCACFSPCWLLVQSQSRR